MNRRTQILHEVPFQSLLTPALEAGSGLSLLSTAGELLSGRFERIG